MWVDKDIQEIKLWLKKNKVSDLVLGRRSSKNPYIVQRIYKNQCRLASLRKVLRYIKAHPRGV